ncbi:MAG: hypothetical protein KatS3mg115_0424 [Candidatus Poribacteria bacterium]|nr:MAG: hypothetical protein KatS3mg115_0424 [Candidatus Poribacteria bacterium]
MSDRLRVAMIGCGGLPSGVLLPALRLVEECRLVATCDLRPEAAERAARRFEAERWYTDYLEMFQKERLDGVLIATPPAVHVQAGIAALEHGLHLFVEKPPAMTAEDARRFRDVARRSGKKVLMGTVRRHAPAHRIAREWMETEAFGTPLVYESHYVCPGPGMRLDWGMDPRSDRDMFRFFLMDHIIHSLDLARFFMGEIVAVRAVRSRAAERQYAGVIQYRFESGAVGSETIAMRSPTFETRVHIVGDGPSWIAVHNWSKIALSVPDLPIGQGGYNDGRAIHWDGGITYQNGAIRPGYREELTAWARAILEDTECRANLEDGYREMLLIEAIMKSVETGEEVAVPVEE